jgi:hypothetical protein
MSKSARKIHPVNKHVKPAQIEPDQTKVSFDTRGLLYILIIALLAAIPFIMGKYIEFNSPDAFDSASNVYSAEHIIQGAKINVDERPSAATGTLIVNLFGVKLFGFSEFGPKFMQLIFQAAALIVMFLAMRKAFGTLAAGIGVIVASIYLSSPIMAKNGNVKDQFMISMMVLGISCFILYLMNNKIWLALLSGAFLAWAPLFKETGYSATGAVGLFIIVKLVFRHTALKKTGINIGLLFAGAAISLAPVFIWIFTFQPKALLPHEVLFRTFYSALKSSDETSEPDKEQAEAIADNTEQKKLPFWLKLVPAGYVRGSWSEMSSDDVKVLFKRVLRYYSLLIIPIALACFAIIIRLIRRILQIRKKLPAESVKPYEQYVFLLAVWWLLDMLFVMGSPRSYEQYYLPLNASGAMLGGYFVAQYSDKYKASLNKPAWLAAGALGVLLMIIAVWPVFFGISKSPHSGTAYPAKQRGYFTQIQEIKYLHKNNLIYPWQQVGDYIKSRSKPDEVIFVWGWYPGIYVRAQRLSSAPKAFEGSMHTLTPEQLSERVEEILSGFKKEPPKFIVDSRKREFPWDRPQLELWPENLWSVKIDQAQDDVIIKLFDEQHENLLKEKYGGEEEALRYKAMAPLRRYMMRYYKVVGKFGTGDTFHVLFVRKSTSDS